ncbi:MAG: class I SAM-dependent methyltransferase [Candidatus Freyarchaeota archaeon]
MQGLAEFLPIRSECLDYALLIFTICFLKKPMFSLREARRVLKHKGTIIIGFISRDSGWGRLYLKKKAEGHKLYGYANFYSPEK